MTIAPVICAPTLAGHQKVAGLWLPADWYDEHARARRILGAWRAGASVTRFDDGDLVRYPDEVEADCGEVRGWPLRREGATFASASLSAAERARLPTADVHIVAGAQARSLFLHEGRALDPSEWLDVDAYALHDTYDLAHEPEPVVELVEPAVDLRKVIGAGAPAPSAARDAFLRGMFEDRKAIRGFVDARLIRLGAAVVLGTVILAAAALLLQMRATAPDAQPPAPPPAAASAPAPAAAEPPSPAPVPDPSSAHPMAPADVPPEAVIPTFVVVFLAAALLGLLIAGALRARRRPGAAAAKKQGAIPQRPSGLPNPPVWRRWLEHLRLTSHLARLYGRRQAQYVRRMLEMFESGRLDEALRHAIPLDSNRPSLGQAIGAPRARDSLSLSNELTAGASINLGVGLTNHLRSLYRRCFEQLDREGRIDEALFVLAELLESRKEALDYLEKKGRYAQAAKLALLWHEPPDLIVRLCCLAQDWRTAVAVARRDNAFANAIVQLEKKWPDVAKRLRIEWAQALATRGEWLAAVDAAWPVESQRREALEWLLRAEAAGGSLSARALVQRASLLPDTLGDHAARLEQLRDDPGLFVERGTVARAILSLTTDTRGTTRLRRLLLPSILADQADGNGLLSNSDLQSLISKANDALLTSDLPPGGLPATREILLFAQTTPLQWTAPDAGRLPIADAVPLSDGRFLVALGEAGAVVVDHHGRMLTRFAVPATRIVIAHSGMIALLLAQRDRVVRVSRVDVLDRRVADLGVCSLDHFADAFDGIAWTVVQEGRLRVLDTSQSLGHVLWQVADLPGPVRTLSVSPSTEQLVLEDGRGGLELWRYRVPERRLTGRDPWKPEGEQVALSVLKPDGGVVEFTLDPPGEDEQRIAYRLHAQNRTTTLPVGREDPHALTALVGQEWMMLTLDPDSSRWWVVSIASGRVHGSLQWNRSFVPRVRWCGSHCLVFDGAGRLFSIDTATSQSHGISLR